MLDFGTTKIEGKLALAPMAGISDSPTRQIYRNMGSAFSYTEFVSTDGIHKGLQRTIDLFRFQPIERPIWFQIFGNNKEIITEACKIISELGPDAIDLNMGCSVSKVAHKGSGAGLLKDPLYVGQIMESMVKSVSIPVTAKIRIGWDEKSLNYREIVHVLQESGVRMISVHGRTKSMGYTGNADWRVIGEIKSFAKVPIWGNGDIHTREDAFRRIRETGVDGVLVGRGAIGNPWLFSEACEELNFERVRSKILEHLELMQRFYGEDYGLILFRKHFNKYLSKISGTDKLKETLLIENDSSKFKDILKSYEHKVNTVENSMIKSFSLNWEMQKTHELVADPKYF